MKYRCLTHQGLVEFPNGFRAAGDLGCQECRNFPRHCAGPEEVREAPPAAEQMRLGELK